MTREDAMSEIEENIIKYMKKYPNHVGNADFWEGFYACRNVVLQLDNEYSPKEQEPCDDAVSRQAVLDCFKKWKPYTPPRLWEFELELSQLPTVRPQEQKMGNWIIIDDCEKFIAKCSECGRIEDSRMISKYPYCHCGAKMESEEQA